MNRRKRNRWLLAAVAVVSLGYFTCGEENDDELSTQNQLLKGSVHSVESGTKCGKGRITVQAVERKNGKDPAFFRVPRGRSASLWIQPGATKLYAWCGTRDTGHAYRWNKPKGDNHLFFHFDDSQQDFAFATDKR